MGLRFFLWERRVKSCCEWKVERQKTSKKIVLSTQFLYYIFPTPEENVGGVFFHSKNSSFLDFQIFSLKIYITMRFLETFYSLLGSQLPSLCTSIFEIFSILIRINVPIREEFLKFLTVKSSESSFIVLNMKDFQRLLRM